MPDDTQTRTDYTRSSAEAYDVNHALPIGGQYYCGTCEKEAEFRRSPDGALLCTRCNARNVRLSGAVRRSSPQAGADQAVMRQQNRSTITITLDLEPRQVGSPTLSMTSYPNLDSTKVQVAADTSIVNGGATWFAIVKL